MVTKGPPSQPNCGAASSVVLKWSSSSSNHTLTPAHPQSSFLGNQVNVRLTLIRPKSKDVLLRTRTGISSRIISAAAATTDWYIFGFFDYIVVKSKYSSCCCYSNLERKLQWRNNGCLKSETIQNYYTP